MLVKIFQHGISLGQAASEQAASAIRDAIANRGRARITLATGTSQFQFLEALTRIEDIDWLRVEAFHLDEYVGISASHPASFRKILLERVVQKTGITKFHPIDGDAMDLPATLQEVGRELSSAPVDLAFIGIGENGHIAFNDPPADFSTKDPYIIVKLDEACRRQQVGEGWFADISAVPTQAISMTPRQILKARQIISVVPGKRKARAVAASLEGSIDPMVPASILRRHPDVTVYLDRDSASLLSPALGNALEKGSQVVVGS